MSNQAKMWPEEHADLLKAWIVRRLESSPVVALDVDVLADFVQLLLRQTTDQQADVREIVASEMIAILEEGESDASIKESVPGFAAAFCDDLMETIRHQLYLPEDERPPRINKALAAAPSGTLKHNDDSGAAAPPSQTMNGSRKRSYHERGDVEVQNGGERQSGSRGRPSKQARRGGRSGSRGGRTQLADGAYAGLATAMGPLPLGSWAVQPAGGFSYMMGLPPNGQLHGPRRRCRDYDTKGVCARGPKCMFEHGNPAAIPLMPPFGPMTSFFPIPAAFSIGSPDEEYDPANPSFMLPLNNQGPAPMSQLFNYGGLFDMPQQSMSKVPPPRNSATRAPFSAEGPVTDRSKSTLVAENIPEVNFSEDQVREFFSQFGQVVQVCMKPYKRLAIIKFDSWVSANAAYKSPKSVFDNRFVKVFWYQGDESQLPPSRPLDGLAPVRGSVGGIQAKQEAEQSEEDLEAGFDRIEFLRKQVEAQRVHEEKQRKIQKIKDERLEVKQKIKQLYQAKAELTAKIAEKSGSSSVGPDGKAVKSQAELVAHLAALEAEAEELGIDEDDTASMMGDNSTTASFAPMWAPRGRGRGRGFHSRAGFPFRGRGGFLPRGRGAFHPGNIRAAFAAYSLDNRPKKVLVKGIDFTEAEKDEALRQYLLSVGDFTDFQATSNSAEVTFRDRRTAEKFFYGAHNMRIPRVEGRIEVAWVGGSDSSAPSTTWSRFYAIPAASGTTDKTTPLNGHAATTVGEEASAGPGEGLEDGELDEEGGEDGSHHAMSDDKDVEIVLDRPRNQEELDYDVAEDW